MRGIRLLDEQVVGEDARMTSDDGFVLAGFVAAPRWLPPDAPWTALLPPSVVTVSDCLTDFVPADDDPLTAPWHFELATALAAGRETGARALSMNLAAPEAEVFLTASGGWGPEEFHPLWRRLTQPVAAPTGAVLGFEVVGFEAGRLHSWLCNSLQRAARDSLGIAVNQVGLLETLEQARAVAAMANRDPGTEEVDWVAARIVEHTGDRGDVDGSTP
ncbi:hypothetical protein R8Z50_23050 [Longispora sp. K20-0274]|uniref:hypothetical protein n=1 Tax=Longispora sp. K20-0274 TaxID=3088255 RepID=UPI00399B4ACE